MVLVISGRTCFLQYLSRLYAHAIASGMASRLSEAVLECRWLIDSSHLLRRMA